MTFSMSGYFEALKPHFKKNSYQTFGSIGANNLKRKMYRTFDCKLIW